MGFWDKKKYGLTTPDTSVDDATNVLEEDPDKFYSQYTQPANDVLKEYLGREPFEFDIDKDELYQRMKDNYIQQGKMAMMDTMGQASALTGGYASSYAQSAGQQAYQGELQKLNDVIPDIYDMALDRYNSEGDELLNKYGILAGLERQDYERYWKENDREYERAKDEKEYDRLYGEPDLVYPNWYNEGGEYASTGEANPTDYKNLYKYLGLDLGPDGIPRVNMELIEAAREKTGIVGGKATDVIDAAMAMMNRELNYGSVDLSDENVANQLKAIKSPTEISAYLDLLEGRGIISPATADYYKSIYSVSSEGTTDSDNVADALDNLVNKGLLDPVVADEWYDEYMKNQEK
jgi:hypothetical protein